MERCGTDRVKQHDAFPVTINPDPLTHVYDSRQRSHVSDLLHSRQETTEPCEESNVH